MGERLGRAAVLCVAMAASLAPAASAKPGDVYLAGNEGAGQADVVRIDPGTGVATDVATLPLAGAGDNAAFGSDGRLYVSDEDNDVVYRVNVATGEVESISYAGFQDPWALDVAPDGRVLVGDYTAGLVAGLIPPSSEFSDVSTGGSLTRLNALGVAPSGRIMVALIPAGPGTVAQVISVDPDTGAQLVIAELSGNDTSSTPQGLAVGLNGTAYISRTASIDRLLPGSAVATELTASPVVVGAYDLELGFNGQLYAANPGTDMLVRVDPRSGAAFNVAGTTQAASVGVAVEPPRCAGRAATIVGTRKRDKIKGSPGADVINALGGADTIRGLKGGDRICGGKGRDRLIGGKGSDRLIGGKGRDRLIGGKGRDRLIGGKGRDRLIGGKGRDRLRGGPGRDRQRQ